MNDPNEYYFARFVAAEYRKQAKQIKDPVEKAKKQDLATDWDNYAHSLDDDLSDLDVLLAPNQ